MLNQVKRFVPSPAIQAYHWGLARASAVLYRHPSRSLIVIGVTGTNGKSSTTQLIGQLLTLLGERVGYTTTAGFKIAGEMIENKMKITMPGRFTLQALLARMVKEDCRYAVVETSSQGIVQFRHLGIQYDVVLMTNLTPEHIEAHGGFDAYKAAKGKLFSHLTAFKKKVIDGKEIPRRSIVNADDEHADYYASFPADEKASFSWDGSKHATLRVEEKHYSSDGVLVMVNGVKMLIPFTAEFQQKNTLAAICAVHELGYSLEAIAAVTEKLVGIAGRFERVNKGQPFEVIVDYAYEPYALKALFEDVKRMNPNRIIGIHGSAGGGRDKSRRVEIGKMAAKEEDIVFVTNEDPYDEDPRVIIEEVAEGARAEGKQEGENLFLVDDRMKAIEQAIAMAEPGDVVLLTGKGSEPVMAVANGKKIPWSDRDAAMRALIKRGYV